MKRTVELFAEPELGLAQDEAAWRSAIWQLDEHSPWKAPSGELSVALLGDASHCQLHDEFLQDPTVTDVITFDGCADLEDGGEICLNVEQARREAAQRALPLGHELALYLVHGYLHLAGLNDHTPDEIAQMRKAEQDLLALLEQAQCPLLKQC